MNRPSKNWRFGMLLLICFLVLMSQPAIAGDTILTNNSGGGNKFFIIENEPSLVINGFDLSPYNLQFPVALDAVTISINVGAPGVPVDLVVYQDANGGSPEDATLIYRQQVSINHSGSIRFLLDRAAIVSEPVIWVGFYLPVGVRFNADTSELSVLTYWAWTTGGTFDVNALSSAEILGPGDGTEPVAINMEGVARITAEIRTPFFEETENTVLVGKQFVDESEQDTTIMNTYDYCGDLLYDPDDITISGEASFTIVCGVASEFEAPTNVAQPSGELLDVQRAGHLYKLIANIPPEQHVHGATNVLPVSVTHCIRIQPGDLGTAIIAETRGIPERWYVLPSVRFGDLVCVELTTASYLSYFLPRTDDSPQNVNLVLGWSRIQPHPLQCGILTYLQIPLVNTGQNWFDTDSRDVKIIAEDIHVQTGTVTAAIELKIPSSLLGPGNRNIIEIGPMIVDQYVHELHRLQVRIDFDEHVDETNEFDNIWFSEYSLLYAGGSDRCYDRAWHVATPYPSTSLDYCFMGQPYRPSVDRGGNDKIWIPYSPACKIDFDRGHVQPRSSAKPPRQFIIKKGGEECTVAISIDVVDQNAKVRFRKMDPDSGGTLCQGRFNGYYNRDHVVLVIDLD